MKIYQLNAGKVRDIEMARSKQQRLVERFVNGKGTGQAGALKVDGNVLFSYGTPIAERVSDGIMVSDRGHTTTTRIHRGHLTNTLEDKGYKAAKGGEPFAPDIPGLERGRSHDDDTGTLWTL